MVSVGSVSVTVVPDARNFDKDLAAQLNPAAKAAGERAGQEYTQGLQDKVKQSQPKVDMPAPDTKKSDAEIDRFLRDFNTKMKKEYDQTGQDSGNSLANGMRLSFVRNSPLIAAAVAGGLIAGAPLAIAGAGVLFAGIAAVADKNSAQLKEAASGAAANIGEVLSSTAQVTVPMFTAALGQVTLAVQRLRPELQTAFSGLDGPIGSLTTGVVNLVQNAMPGLTAAIRNAGPVFAGLASLMGEVGTGLGQFFQLVSQHGSQAGQVFASLGQILGAALPILGRLIDIGVQLGAQVLPPVAGALRLVADALGVVAPVLPVVVASLGGLLIARSLQGPLQALAQNLAFASYNGSVFAGTAGKLSTAVSGLATGLPALGVAVGIATQIMQRSDDQAKQWAQDLLNGGKAADTARTQMSNFGQAMAATNSGTGGFLANLIGLGVPMDNTAIALSKVKDAQKDLTASMSPLQAAQQKVTQAQNDYLAAMADPHHSSQDAANKAIALGDAEDNLSRIQGQLDSATKTANTALGNFKGTLQTTADTASAANTQIGLLKTSLDALTGKTVTMDEAEVAVTNATIAATTALQGKSGALVDATGKLNLNTEAGAAAFTSLKNLAGADNTLISTMEQQGATTDQVKAKDGQLRDSFIQTAIKMGFSADQAHNLADQIYGIPSERNVQIDTNAAAAAAVIKTVQDQLDNLHGRNVTIDIIGNASGPGGISGPAAYAVPGSGLGGLAEGGYTGDGGKYTPAGIVHAGEFVFPQEAVSRLGVGFLGALAGLPGYAGGGPVFENIFFDPSNFNTNIQRAANSMRDAMVAAAASAGGGNVQQWAGVAAQALAAEGEGATWLGLLLQRMNQESGGNASIVNTSDSNWAAGTPSVGLLQVIGPTYQAYKDPRFDVGPYLYGTSIDPMANITAAIRYTEAAYGSLSAWGRPGGYELGTNYVPRDGLAYLHRGEAVVPAEKNVQGSPWQDGGSVVLQLDGPATTDLLEGRAVRVVHGTLDDLATNASRR